MFPNDTPLMVMCESFNTDGTPSSAPLAGTWEPQTQTLTVITEYLSRFWPFKLDIAELVSDSLQRSMGLIFSRPSCAYQPLTMTSTRYVVEQINNESI